jgi:hypothetical protein
MDDSRSAPARSAESGAPQERVTPAPAKGSAPADPAVAVPYRYLVSALIALAAFAALLPLWSGSLLGFWLAPDLLLMTHVLTLGFLTMAVIGASLELLPAALGVARRLDRLAGLIYYPYVIGVAVLLVGFGASSAAAQIVGGVLLAVAIAGYLAVMVATLLAATIDALTDTYIVVAFAAFLVAALLGIVLLLNATGGILAQDHTPRLATHAGMALGGWLTLMLYAAAYRFLPLVSPAHRAAQHRPVQAQLWLTVLGLVMLLVGGLAGGSTGRVLTSLAILLVAAGAAIFVWQLARLYTQGDHVTLDVSYPFAVTAALLWLVALCVASGAVWDGRSFGSPAFVVAGWLGLFGWAGMMVLGHLYRVDVLLAWLDRRPSTGAWPETLDAPFPVAADAAARPTVPPTRTRFGLLSWALCLLGTVGVAVGVAVGTSALVLVAALAVTLGIVVCLVDMVMLLVA